MGASRIRGERTVLTDEEGGGCVRLQQEEGEKFRLGTTTT